MLAELVDAVVGVDTHRDTHQVEIALPSGAPIAVTTISNDTTGYAELLAWIVDHAPGPRLAVSIEGTRSYGIGLARAAAAAGLIVLECEQPHRKARRGGASPTRSTPTWPCWPRCAWTPTGCPPHAPTATARRCGSCSVHVRNSPPPAPRRPTGCGRCCWAATTPTANTRAARSPTPAWPAWPDAGLWVPRTVTRPLISAFAVSGPTSRVTVRSPRSMISRRGLPTVRM